MVGRVLGCATSVCTTSGFLLKNASSLIYDTTLQKLCCRIISLSIQFLSVITETISEPDKFQCSLQRQKRVTNDPVFTTILRLWAVFMATKTRSSQTRIHPIGRGVWDTPFRDPLLPQARKDICYILMTSQPKSQIYRPSHKNWGPRLDWAETQHPLSALHSTPATGWCALLEWYRRSLHRFRWGYAQCRIVVSEERTVVVFC